MKTTLGASFRHRVEYRAVGSLRKFPLPCSYRAKDITLLPSTAIPSPAPGGA